MPHHSPIRRVAGIENSAGRMKYAAGLEVVTVTHGEPTRAMITTTTSQLRRPVNDRVLFGVCSGIARRYDFDPLWVRFAFLLTAVAGGPGVIAYLILWFLMPQDHLA